MKKSLSTLAIAVSLSIGGLSYWSASYAIADRELITISINGQEYSDVDSCAKKNPLTDCNTAFNKATEDAKSKKVGVDETAASHKSKGEVDLYDDASKKPQ